MAEICVKKEIDDELVMENKDSVNSLNGNQTDIISKHTDNMQTVSIKSENKWDDIATIEPPVTKYEKFQYPNHNVFEKNNEEVSENTKINKSVVSKNESGPEGIFIKKEITEEFIIKDESDLMQVDSLENTQLPESDRYFSSVAGPSATHKSDMEITESTSFSGELESVLNFEPEEETCILCQTTGGVINVSERTCATFIKAFELRSENDTEIDANMHNIVLQLKTNWQNIQWHNRCYTSYTSKKNIEVFRNRIRTLQEYQELGIRPPNPSQRFLRKNPFDIKKCVFCQKKKLGKRLSQVMSKNIESKIRNVGNKNFEILKRIGMNDLIAMKVKYHPGCLPTQHVISYAYVI